MKNWSKILLGCAAFAAPMLALGVTLPVQAQNSPAPSNNVCLDTDEVRTTETKGARTILFHMRNGAVWQNDLATPCPGLVSHGSTWSQTVHTDRICANQQRITLEVNGVVCRLGPFTRVK